MASGFSRRFGGDKLLSPLGGAPLYRHAFTALPATLFDRAVVTSRFPEILDYAQHQGYDARKNPGAGEGVAAGIRLGLAGMEDLDGVLFAVCDQPWLTRGSVERLIAAFASDPRSITALSWGGKKGNPVIFPADLIPELRALIGDRGGSAVIRNHLDRLRLVAAESADELRDVDTPEDL
ncbi:MAG: nucleotidyltransferase family protein [Clostridia bacterium]|nr:nucleotidyltransferase family protein [Clostridia bacterium]